MRSRAQFLTAAGGYLTLVAITAVITGPDVLRGADGLEIGPLLLLGLPCSFVLMFVAGWGLLPFGDTASDWGLLIGLVTGSVANAAIAYRIWVRGGAASDVDTSSRRPSGV